MSEIDYMAITGILSTQLLHSFFVEKSITPNMERDNVNLEKIVFENQ